MTSYVNILHRSRYCFCFRTHLGSDFICQYSAQVTFLFLFQNTLRKWHHMSIFCTGHVCSFLFVQFSILLLWSFGMEGDWRIPFSLWETLNVLLQQTSWPDGPLGYAQKCFHRVFYRPQSLQYSQTGWLRSLHLKIGPFVIVPLRDQHGVSGSPS